jgi:hypothetical protein
MARHGSAAIVGIPAALLDLAGVELLLCTRSASIPLGMGDGKFGRVVNIAAPTARCD